MIRNFSFEAVKPSNLSQGELSEIFRIEQDMWGRKEGLGEYMRCNTCDVIYSKQDMYDEKDKVLYNFTVSEIEQRIGKIPKCKSCKGEMEHCFSQEKCIEEIKVRYSLDAHLVLMRSNGGQINGFMDGYADSFDRIYDMELSDHYGKIGKDAISNRISEILDGNMPDVIFNCCSMGTRQEFMSLKYIYMLLQTFFINFPHRYSDILGLSELHKGGTLDKMYQHLGSQDIGMSQHADQISCSEDYNSGIFLQKRLGKTYKDGFSKDLKTFLRERTI